MKFKHFISVVITAIIVSIIVSYMMITSPAIFKKAVENFQNSQAAQAQKGPQEYVKNLPAKLKANAKELMTNDLVIGNPNAKKTVIEFLDYGCSACRYIEEKFMKKFVEQNKDKVRFVFKPLAFISPESTFAAISSIYTYQNDQKDFLRVHEGLFATDPNSDEGMQLPKEDVLNVLKSNKVPTAQLVETTNVKSDMSSKIQKAVDVLKANSDLAGEDKLGIKYTPTLIVVPTNFNANTPVSEIKVFIPEEGFQKKLEAAIQ